MVSHSARAYIGLAIIMCFVAAKMLIQGEQDFITRSCE